MSECNAGTLIFVIFIISQDLWTLSKQLLTPLHQVSSNATLLSTLIVELTPNLKQHKNQEVRELTVQEVKVEETIVAEISRKMRMEPKENSEAEVVVINVVSNQKTQRIPKTLFNQAITFTRRNLSTIVKAKTLLIVVAANTVVEVIALIVVVVATVTGRKPDQFRRLSSVVTRRSLM